MQHLRCLLPIQMSIGVATRLTGHSTQTVVATVDGFMPLVGSIPQHGIKIGPLLNLYEAPPFGTLPTTTQRLRFLPHEELACPVWDPWSASLYAIHGEAIMRITGDEVSLLTGSVQEGGELDGAGRKARFRDLFLLASDGAGALYCTGKANVRKVQLPAALQASSAGAPVAAVAGGEAVVTTLRLQTASHIIWGLVHVPDPNGGPGCLVYATRNTLHRVQLNAEGGATTSVLLAGREGEGGLVDGRGQGARFRGIASLAVDAHGNILCADNDAAGGRPKSVLRLVTPDGTVTTLTSELERRVGFMSILPNGCVAMCTIDHLVVMDLGMKPQPLSRRREEPSSPPTRTVVSDLAALLERQPDGTADLTLQLQGGRIFHVHRAILSARCDYFRQRLAEGSGFADGGATQLTLPDADPEAFALVLRFIYADAVDIPPDLACAVAELADRLLLPQLTATACSQVLADLNPLMAVDTLLWAERCSESGGSFRQLLADLKTWYVEHYDDVEREAPGSMRQLAAASPDLVEELYNLQRAAKRRKSF